MNLIKIPPTTSRNDVSDNEMKLRKLDNRDRLMRVFEVVILAVVVLICLLVLLNVNENSAFNKKSIIEHSKSVEEHRNQLEDAKSAGAEQLRDAAVANKARADINLCINSTTNPTPEYIKKCYDDVEKKLGVKVERYGHGL